MQNWYREDLAYIHDVGYNEFALQSAPGLLEIFRQNNIHTGLVVDLGCGSGLWARELLNAKYQVLGIDISEDMIAIARQKAPEADFRVESLFKAEIPPCVAVTSISECLNYCFDPDCDRLIPQLFQRIYNVLCPGGVFVFDFIQPGYSAIGSKTRNFNEGEDWLVLVEKEEHVQATLSRRIITLRQVGDLYRRDDELHQVRLYKAATIAEDLQQFGFQVEILNCYGHYRLPQANAAVIARKLA
jgi:SAM-dependent methyltransferase